MTGPAADARGAHLYDVEDGIFNPTRWAGSPWVDGAQHGAPANALVMCAAEAAAAETGMEVSRITVELLKPVPKVPLEVRRDFIRRGRRMSVVDVWVVRPGDDTPACAGRAILLAPGGSGTSVVPPAGEMPRPDEADAVAFMSPERHAEMPFGFHFSLEVRWRPKEGIAWLTSALDFGPGRPLTPLERAAALADFATVISYQLYSERHGAAGDETMMNVDTSLYLTRRPVGEWIGMSDAVLADEDGRGATRVALHDVSGPLGQVAQTTIGTTLQR